MILRLPVAAPPVAASSACTSRRSSSGVLRRRSDAITSSCTHIGPPNRNTLATGKTDDQPGHIDNRRATAGAEPLSGSSPHLRKTQRQHGPYHRPKKYDADETGSDNNCYASQPLAACAGGGMPDQNSSNPDCAEDRSRRQSRYHLPREPATIVRAALPRAPWRE